jgi:hypothetical protein
MLGNLTWFFALISFSAALLAMGLPTVGIQIPRPVGIILCCLAVVCALLAIFIGTSNWDGTDYRALLFQVVPPRPLRYLAWVIPISTAIGLLSEYNRDMRIQRQAMILAVDIESFGATANAFMSKMSLIERAEMNAHYEAEYRRRFAQRLIAIGGEYIERGFDPAKVEDWSVPAPELLPKVVDR